MRRVAVLGAGLQGACVALDLASTGIAVDLFERDAQPLTRASAQNEGKIHLGYVYAGDRTMRSARTMVKGALRFAPLMRRWIGDALDAVPVSTPFRYVVHAHSLLGVAEIEAHLRGAHAIALEESCDAGVDYFGRGVHVPLRRLRDAEFDALFDRRTAIAAYDTPEIGIDTEALCGAVRERLAREPSVRCRTQTRVTSVDATGTEPVVTFESNDGPGREAYPHVVNALGEERMAIDATAGIVPARPWSHRVKHFLRVRAPADAAGIPSATIVFGPFGDVAVYGNGEMYLSWYPAGRRGFSTALWPPPWPLVLEPESAAAMRRSIVAGLAGVVPALARLPRAAVDACEVKAGIIHAWGVTDIDDPTSGLHERHAIGPHTHGRYHSIDTGKLTVAPLFAAQVADRIRRTG